MKPSGKAASLAPRAPASAISEQAFSTVASRSRKTGAACTAATRNGASLTRAILDASRSLRQEPRLASPANGVVNGPDLRRAGIDADLLEDRHERRAELLEGLHRLPDVDDPQIAALAVTDVVKPSGRRAGAGRGEPPNGLIVTAGIHRGWLE